MKNLLLTVGGAFAVGILTFCAAFGVWILMGRFKDAIPSKSGTQGSPANLQRTPVQLLSEAGMQGATADLQRAPVLPPSEAEFISVVSTAQSGSSQAENDMQRGGIKATRDEGICRVMVSINFTAEDWTGTVTKIDSNSDGKGVMYISIARGIILETWNNDFSDMFDNTLLRPQTELFKTASFLKEGQQVTFSGAFIPHKEDCIKESSLTLRGKLDDPEFIFRFSHVAPFVATARRTNIAPSLKQRGDTAPETATRNPKAEPGYGTVKIPFVGCRSDGQVGPMEAPRSASPSVPTLTLQDAHELAYYESADGVGVLGPRGWYCFGTYGSNGSNLFVSPQPIDAAGVFSKDFGFSGPAIQLSFRHGGTSGRFEVAEIIARVFPTRKAFATGVMMEGLDSPLTFGPYPNDVLAYRSNTVVEYQTPARTDGLGTRSWLRANDHPIDGVAILVGQTPDSLHLALRLWPEKDRLRAVIMRQVERDAFSQPK